MTAPAFTLAAREEADALAELLTLFVDHARPLDHAQLAAAVLARVTPYPSSVGATAGACGIDREKSTAAPPTRETVR